MFHTKICTSCPGPTGATEESISKIKYHFSMLTESMWDDEMLMIYDNETV